MRDPRSLYHPDAFQLNWLSAQVVEHTHACAKQHRHEIDVDFVEQSGFEALLHDVRAAYADILVPLGKHHSLRCAPAVICNL